MRSQAGVYFPDFDSREVQVRLKCQSQRHYSALFEFDLIGKRVRHTVIVKIPFISQPGWGSGRREMPKPPRLFPAVLAEEMGRLEHQTLCAIREHFRQIGDPRFDTIRVLELLSQPYAIVMEKRRSRNLRRLLNRYPRLLRFEPIIDLHAACRHSGLWLRHYHQLPPLPHTQLRNQTSEDYRQSLESLTRYLRDTGESSLLLNRYSEPLICAVGEVLPKYLPVGTAHGDFAARNILVDLQGQITVFDTLARWQAPIYEDLGSFLIALKASGAQVASQGLCTSPGRLQEYESEFLRGYFGQHLPPMAAIRLFEGHAIMDKWAGLVYQHKIARGARRIYLAARLMAFRRFLSRYFEQIFDHLKM